MLEILVYSAIFAGRDQLQIPKIDGIDFRLITDEEKYASMPGVTVTPLPIAKDPRRSARFFKAMPQVFFPNYRRWIWIDGDVFIQDGISGKDLDGIKGPLAAFKHRERNCAYDEAEACNILKLDAEPVIRSQVEGYQAEGFPAKAGLAETGMVLRDNTPEIRAFNRAWWSEISTKSVRDQISFNYVAWKLKLEVHYIGRCTETPWFRLGAHLT